MKTINFFYTALLLLCASINAEIIETCNFHEVQNYIKEDTLVVLDIDFTIMETSQELGNDQWFYSRIQHYISEGLSIDESLSKTLPEWMAIQHVTGVKLVEDDIAKLIQDMQEQEIPVIGLTTRCLNLSLLTCNQLKSLDVDLSKTAINDEDIFFKNGANVLYTNGIIFTEASHKGKALFGLLSRSNYKPEHILFVNDKHSHILPVEETCLEKNIPFTGLRYSYIDEKRNNFRHELADIQYEDFWKILSNKEAEEVLLERETM
jgi:hypothetical protein